MPSVLRPSVIRRTLSRRELSSLAPELGDMIKAGVDINVRPSRGNRSRDVEDPAVRDAIRQLVTSLVRDA